MIRDKELEALISAGEHWKAKEKLQGRLAQSGYDTELLEQYGNVLLSMHDKLEAGKYLFLSGERSPAYSENIELYLKRYAGKDSNYIFNTFPKNVQKSTYEQYPETVKSDLASLKMQPKEIKERASKSYESAKSDKFFLYGCGLALIVLVVLFLIGVVHGVGVLWLYVT